MTFARLQLVLPIDENEVCKLLPYTWMDDFRMMQLHLLAAWKKCDAFRGEIMFSAMAGGRLNTQP